MIWQDVVITMSQLFFLLALIPTIRSSDQKPPLSTALITALFMTVLVPTMFTLHLYLSVAMTSGLTVGWWIIAFQVWRRETNSSKGEGSPMITLEYRENLGWCATRGAEGSEEYLHRDGVWRSSPIGEDRMYTGYFTSRPQLVSLAKKFGEIRILASA